MVWSFSDIHNKLSILLNPVLQKYGGFKSESASPCQCCSKLYHPSEQAVLERHNNFLATNWWFIYHQLEYILLAKKWVIIIYMQKLTYFNLDQQTIIQIAHSESK